MKCPQKTRVPWKLEESFENRFLDKFGWSRILGAELGSWKSLEDQIAGPNADRKDETHEVSVGNKDSGGY